MSIWFMSLFVLIVIYSKLSLYSTSCAHQTVIGNLNGAWQMNFTIFAKEFNGSILFCIDSLNNQFGVKVTKGLSNERNIAITFNKKKKVVPLLNLCGCTTCNDRKMTFKVSVNNWILEVVCNNNDRIQLYYSDHYYNSWITESSVEGLDKSYLMPMHITDGSGSMYVMIGNVGKYLTIINTINIPLSEQMLGCVDALYFNNKLITLISGGNDVRPSCSMKCTSHPCNGGLCNQISPDNFTCDCSTTALNGRYCNLDLKVYNRGDYNSYEQRKEAAQIYLKMTWHKSSERRYCLMEIIGGGTSYFLLNSSFLPNINIGEVNFVTVNIANGDLSIKMKNYESRIAFLSYGNTRINVGFSERNWSCETFQGAYGLHYDSSVLRQIGTTVTDGATVPNNTNLPSFSMILLVLIISGIALLIAFIILYLWKVIYKCLSNSNTAIVPRVNDYDYTDDKEANLTDSLCYDKLDYDSLQKEDSYYLPMSRPLPSIRQTNVYDDYVPTSQPSNVTQSYPLPPKDVYVATSF